MGEGRAGPRTAINNAGSAVLRFTSHILPSTVFWNGRCKATGLWATNPHNSRRFQLQPTIRKSELIAVFFLRARIIQRALDLASAVTTHLTAGGFAARSVNILSGTDAFPLGACTRLRSGTGIAAARLSSAKSDGRASPCLRAPISPAASRVSSRTLVTNAAEGSCPH